jgi:hypothetical protein
VAVVRRYEASFEDLYIYPQLLIDQRRLLLLYPCHRVRCCVTIANRFRRRILQTSLECLGLWLWWSRRERWRECLLGRLGGIEEESEGLGRGGEGRVARLFLLLPETMAEAEEGEEWESR